MKRIFVLLSFACIALSGYSQEHASQYYMSYFAKYYRIDVVNYENEGFCAKIDPGSAPEPTARPWCSPHQGTEAAALRPPPLLCVCLLRL